VHDRVRIFYFLCLPHSEFYDIFKINNIWINKYRFIFEIEEKYSKNIFIDITNFKSHQNLMFFQVNENH